VVGAVRAFVGDHSNSLLLHCFGVKVASWSCHILKILHLASVGMGTLFVLDLIKMKGKQYRD